MNKGFRHLESVVSAVSAGFFLILVGTVFAFTPNLFDHIVNFFQDFKITKVPNMDISTFAPAHPYAHSLVYSAFVLFSLAWGVFQILILILRFAVHSPLGKKAETVSGIVFWLGSHLLARSFLNEATTVRIWFVFWTAILVLIGASLVVRGLILAFGRFSLSSET